MDATTKASKKQCVYFTTSYLISMIPYSSYYFSFTVNSQKFFISWGNKKFNCWRTGNHWGKQEWILDLLLLFSQGKQFFQNQSWTLNLNCLQKGKYVMHKMCGLRRRKWKIHVYRNHGRMFCLTSVRTSAENNLVTLEIKQKKRAGEWVGSCRFW